MTGLLVLPPEIGRSALGLSLVFTNKAYVFINFQMEILAFRYMFVDNATVYNLSSSPFEYFLFSVKYEYEYSSVRTHEDANIVQAEGVFPHILACSVSYTLCSGRFSLESVISIL
jgi:hypothetical protein